MPNTITINVVVSDEALAQFGKEAGRLPGRSFPGSLIAMPGAAIDQTKAAPSASVPTDPLKLATLAIQAAADGVVEAAVGRSKASQASLVAKAFPNLNPADAAAVKEIAKKGLPAAQAKELS